MKTTVNFLEAVRALTEGKCEKIESPGGVLYNIEWNTISPTNTDLNPGTGISLSCSSFLGEWKLISVKRKVVIEDVIWDEDDECGVWPEADNGFMWRNLLNKPKMKMTLEWIS